LSLKTGTEKRWEGEIAELRFRELGNLIRRFECHPEGASPTEKHVLGPYLQEFLLNKDPIESNRFPILLRNAPPARFGEAGHFTGT
jgi:hypothetical protein